MKKQLWKLKGKKFGYHVLQKSLSFGAVLGVVSYSGTPNIYLHNFMIILIAFPLILAGMFLHWLLSKVFFENKYKTIDSDAQKWRDRITEDKMKTVETKLEAKQKKKADKRSKKMEGKDNG